MSVILTDKIQPRTTGIALTVVGDTNVSGALTCTNFTASGDVSIGGTLTYEDVTNIDSVGLITARTGVRVTAGGVVVTAGVSTFTDDVKVNSTLTATEGINVTAGVTTIAGDLLIADQIIHSGDSNTSIRFPAADQVKITTAGGSSLHIAAGKIGVGGDPTAYPGKFMVIGAAGGASGIVCDREIVSRVSSGIANTERGFQQIIDGVEKLACFADNSGNFNLNNNNGKNRITVTEAGKVGLGTVNPQLNLHIHTESSNASFAHFTNTSTGVSGSDGVSIGLDSDENVAIFNYESSALRFATSGTERLRIDSGGQIANNSKSASSYGSPDLLIAGVGTAHNIVCMQNSASTGDCASIGFRVAGESSGDYTKVGIFAQRTATDQGWNNLDLVFAHNTVDNPGQVMVADEKFRFMSTGIVDINNAAGQSYYQITQASGNTVKFGIVSGSDIELSGSSNNSMYFKTNNTERLRITGSGLVGIGTDNPTAYLSFNAQRSTQTMPPICFQSSYGTSLADAAISTTDDTGGTDVMMGSNLYMGQNGTFVKYSASYGSAAVRCQYTGNTLFYNKSGNNNPVESLRITGSGYREIRNAHFGAYAFTDNSAKTTITIGDPGDSKCTTVRFLLTLEDVSYRQGFWQGEYTVFVSNATGGPGVNYYLKEHWQQIGSTNWSGGSVSVAMSGGAVQVTATNGHNDANGDIYVHILQVVGDIDGSTVASIS